MKIFSLFLLLHNDTLARIAVFVQVRGGYFPDSAFYAIIAGINKQEFV